jgi:hypothetical protein
MLVFEVFEKIGRLIITVAAVLALGLIVMTGLLFTVLTGYN